MSTATYAGHDVSVNDEGFLTDATQGTEERAAEVPRSDGGEAKLFLNFVGRDAVTRRRHEHIKVATVGNPGLHVATLVGSLPGIPGLMTGYLEHKMAKLDSPPIPEFIEMIADSGAGIY